MSTSTYQVNREDVHDEDVVGKEERNVVELPLSGVQHHHVKSEF